MLEESAQVKKLQEVRSAKDIHSFVDYILRITVRTFLTSKRRQTETRHGLRFECTSG